MSELRIDNGVELQKDEKMAKNIEVLREEHENIKKMIEITESAAIDFMNDKEAPLTPFYDFIDFARNYGDKHHHGKEELVLFKYMVDNLGPLALKLVNGGMLVEHDLGRLYVKNVEESLELYKETREDIYRLKILGNVLAYGELLNRHIEKENTVVYPFAERMLSAELMEKIEEESIDFEKENQKRKEKYEGMLKRVSK